MRTVNINGEEQVLTPRFRFEPGSYGDAGHFMPSIACLEQVAVDQWEHAYMLVNPSEAHPAETASANEASRNLDAAFRRAEQAGSEVAVGEYLSGLGYMRVDGFNVADDE